jgi:hypothetical protein
MNWAQDSFSPIPTFVDTGATLIDKSNVESFIKARSSATAANNRKVGPWTTFLELVPIAGVSNLR